VAEKIRSSQALDAGHQGGWSPGGRLLRVNQNFGVNAIGVGLYPAIGTLEGQWPVTTDLRPLSVRTMFLGVPAKPMVPTMSTNLR
jgi:hypothetical protein